VHWNEMVARGTAVKDTALAARTDAVDPEDLAFFMYTSGTTGFPKGTMHAHRLIRNVVDRAFRLGITPARRDHDLPAPVPSLRVLRGHAPLARQRRASGAHRGVRPEREPRPDRARAGDRPPRLRHALQGAGRGAGTSSARHVERAHRHRGRR